jgi:hypothetical protein
MMLPATRSIRSGGSVFAQQALRGGRAKPLRAFARRSSFSFGFMKRSCGLGAVAVTLSLCLGCSATPEDPTVLAGYADNSEGQSAAAEMCRSTRQFVSSSLDPSGLRRAWFLPFGSYDDGSFDFYAPMASEPADRASKAFYRRKVGQLTHYLRASDFAAALAGCLTQRHGYVRICQSRTPETFRASFTETRTGRSIEIVAAGESTAVLVAKKGWNGNLEQFLYRTSEDAPNRSMQPTCVNARG